MSKEKAKISKIIITIAGTEIVCTPDQIRDLKEALDEMYPAPIEIIHDWYHRVPRLYWESPSFDEWGAGDVTLCAS